MFPPKFASKISNIFSGPNGLFSGPAGMFSGKQPSQNEKLTIQQGGQSLGQYYFLRGDPIVSIKFVEWLRAEMGYPSSGTIINSLSPLPYITTDASSRDADDYHVRYVNAASGGSNLVDVSAPAAIATGNYWYNTQNNSATSPDGALDAVPNTPGPLWRAAMAYIDSYGCDVYAWSQGQTEVTYVTTLASRVIYENTLRLFIAACRTQSGNPNLPFVFQHIDRNNVYTDAGLQIISEIQTKISLDTDNVYVGTEEYFSSFCVAAFINTCGTTNGSPIVTCPSTTGLAVNMNIQGAGIPDNSYILSIVPNVSFTLSKNATATATVTLNRMDDTHPYPAAYAGFDNDQTQGFYSIAKRIVDPIRQILSGTTKKAFGPYVSSIEVNYGASTIDLNITHDKGSDLTTLNGSISSICTFLFRVENNGSLLTITNVQKISGSKLRLTVSGTISDGTVYVWPAYGAMNKQDYRDIIIDNALTALPLQRQSPVLVPALRSFTDTGRTDLQSAGFANVVAQWDATLSGSYNGFDTQLRNLIASPADGSAKAAYDLLMNLMTFTGTAGLPTAKFVAAGTTSYFKIAANTTFLNNLHKTSGGQPVQAHTLVMLFRTPNVTTSAYLMSTFNTTSQPGYAINFNAGVLATRQRGDTASIVASGGSVAINTDYLYIETKTSGGNGYGYWINTRTGTFTTMTFNACVSDASSLFHLFARSDAGQGLIANSEFKGAALLNINCDDTLAAQLADYYNTLHSTTYA